jgi:PAS domain S-box-containing protein
MIIHNKNIENSRIDMMLETIMEVAQGNYYAQIELSEDNDSHDALAMGINLMIDDIRVGIDKIERERDFTNNVITSITDLIVVIDAEEKIILINEPGSTLLGYTDQKELIGKSLNAIFQEDVFEGSFGSEDKYLVKNIEKNLVTIDGNMIPVLFSTSLLKNKNNKVTGVIGIARDISDKKLIEEKSKKYMGHLEKVNKELDHFAYIVSHDLKAPLRAIANLSEWIQEDLGTEIPEDIADKMKLLVGRVHRMEALINGILSYSKSTRSKVEIEKIEMDKVFDELLENLDIPEWFSVIRKGNFPVIYNNRTWIEQIFSNLLSNAVKHHDKTEGKIELGYKEDNEYHQFSVRDDGPGISPEFHEKIFTIFQTLEARDTVENTGVGLSIVKKIIEEQGGTIWVESEKGKGTMFVFRIPKELKNKINL